MCGISVLKKQPSKTSINSYIRYRGPDEHVSVDHNRMTFTFDRLAINDVNNGSQPFTDETTNSIFVCNGEIYNSTNIECMYQIACESRSDCEPVFRTILKIVKSNIVNDIVLRLTSMCKTLDGDFAFVFANPKYVVVCRDPIGVRPLFVAKHGSEIIGFASEAKAFKEMECKSELHIEQFPPGHVWILNTHDNSIIEKINYNPLTYPLHVPLDNVIEVINQSGDMQSFEQLIRKYTNHIHTLLYKAVEKRITTSDQPVAFFLSGGLDSSIIAAIGAKVMAPKRITCYSVGTKGASSPDLIAATKVAEHIGAEHIVLEFDVSQAIEEISNVIYHLESYDCTTIRASVPMFLLSKHVAMLNRHKVILSGEGADELFGGYLYFHNAPTVDEFQYETISLLKNVHQFDVLRADRCVSGNGLELRVPFFDKKLIEYVCNIPPIMKTCNDGTIEKKLLRDSFVDYLPRDILYRQKNGMSDAVGFSWVDHLKNHSDTLTTLTPVPSTLPNQPTSKEETWYRSIFIDLFGNKFGNLVSHLSIWRPKWTDVLDPSARKLPSFMSQ